MPEAFTFKKNSFKDESVKDQIIDSNAKSVNIPEPTE